MDRLQPGYARLPERPLAPDGVIIMDAQVIREGDGGPAAGIGRADDRAGGRAGDLRRDDPGGFERRPYPGVDIEAGHAASGEDKENAFGRVDHGALVLVVCVFWTFPPATFTVPPLF